jgi:host factor-I protein
VPGALHDVYQNFSIPDGNREQPRFCPEALKQLQWQGKPRVCGFILMQAFLCKPTEERDRQMENKPAQNIQDSFLNTARKDKTQITIYLLSGVKLTGRIRSFDKYSVVLETNNQEQLIFKHAISTVVMAKGSHHGERSHAMPAEGESSPLKAEG